MASSTLNNNIATPEKVKQLLSSFIVSHDDADTVSSISKDISNSSINVSSSESPKEGSKQRDTSKQSSALRSYDSYIERLATFSSISWFNKPAELCPLVLARHGWAVKEADLLQCRSCEACLSAQLPSRVNAQLYKEALSKLKEKLISAHDKFCLLAVKPCPERFSKVPLDDPAKLTSAFAERFNNLSKIGSKLPDLNYKRLRELGYDEGQGAAYCKKYLTSDLDPSLPAVALAFTGWTLSSCKDVLVCVMCRRQVGLWNFLPSEPSAVMAADSSTCPDPEADDSSDTSGKRRRLSDPVKTKLDPLAEHRPWCPWLTPCSSLEALGSSPPPSSSSSPSSSPPSLPACVVAIKVVAPGLMDNNTGLAHAMRTSPMVEGLRCFRRVIRSWSSPKVNNNADSSTVEDSSPDVICTSPEDVITPKIINNDSSPVSSKIRIPIIKIVNSKLKVQSS